MVSTDGTVLSLRCNRALRQHITASGRARIALYLGGIRPAIFFVHRVTYEAWVGRIPNKMQINHIDGDPLNNHLENLEVVTPEENIAHAVHNGLTCHGEKNGRGRLTARQVREIRKLLAKGRMTQPEIGAIYAVDRRTISAINTKASWSRTQ